MYYIHMTAQDVYHRFGTPINLQQHMLAVTSLICSLRDHWSGDTVNWDHAITAGLLHDLGNVIKFNFDEHAGHLGDEINNIEYWKNEQKRLMSLYGADEYIATGMMLDEIGVWDEVKNTIQEKSFGNIIHTANSSSWLVKILQYCDLRVNPDGLVGLDERLEYARRRYTKYSNRSDFPDMIDAAKHIEKQISQSTDASLDTIISPDSILKYENELLEYRITLR